MNNDRKQEALKVRVSAAELAASRPHPCHIANGDEQKFRKIEDEIKKDEGCKPGDGFKFKPSYLASFTKGMPHNYKTGLVCTHEDFQQFVKAIDSGDPRDFKDTNLGPGGNGWKSEKAKKYKAEVRAWESQGAGSTYDLEGPDAQAVTMPPAPAMGSDELTAEMAEVYAQALLRDVPFTEIVDGSGKVYFNCPPDGSPPDGKPDTTVKEVVDILNELTWFKTKDCCELTPAEASRKRKELTSRTAFRGITPGDNVGPYISQFLLAGNEGINDKDKERLSAEGLISYGAVNIDQRVRFARPCEDHMTTWDEWYDVQQGADLRDLECYVDKPKRRFITTPRDLATYVHYDALYEAYLNACLILLGKKVPFDPDIPFQGKDIDDHQQGFAHFGGPHILSLVTEVATRALKAVRFQKFNIHRRLRPETLAARFARHEKLNVKEVTKMFKEMYNNVKLKKLLDLVAKKNGNDPELKENYLLPMAFCEGSPMHPSYGAGHATVAGACVTILKAFFDHKYPLADKAYVAEFKNNKSSLKSVPVVDEEGNPGILTVEGELNKLASNISIGRNWAGVHYFSDYIESLRMGEKIAIGILEEQKLTYGENFSMTVPLFDGGSIRI
jgi:hypothetical protein